MHALDPFAERAITEPEIWVCDPVDAAIVLGSRQSPDLLDQDACREAGLSVVRRRSGGGAVLLRPDAAVWIDVVLPHGVAPDDVRASMVWIGERWGEALADLVVGKLSVHDGGMVTTPWSDLVCFAGIGPGEILVGGRKFLGLSQRRNRHGIRIQGTMYRRPVTAEIPNLLLTALPDAELIEPHSEPEISGETLAARLAALLDAT